MRNSDSLCRLIAFWSLGMALGSVGCGSSPSPEGTPVASLTVLLQGDQSGSSVVSQPVGIDCGTTCKHAFTSGQSVTLSVQPTATTNFVGWDGACTGTAQTCTLTMDADKSVGATFATKPNVNVALTIGGTGSGVVTSMPVGIQCASGTCSGAFPGGTMLTLTAAPDATSYFTGWTGACTGSARTCTVQLASDVQISATFGNPSSCEQLRADNPALTDGTRTLFIGGTKTKPWDAYCVMSTSPALTYLTLTNVGGNFNFSQYTAGGASPGTNVRTSYTRVLIDPASLKIDTNDKRFATSTGSLNHSSNTLVTEMPFAYAMGCVNASANGQANIDLTGTKFAVGTGAVGIAGNTPLGTTTPTPNGQVRAVNMTGGGFCGWNGAVGSSGPFNSSGAPLQLVYFP